MSCKYVYYMQTLLILSLFLRLVIQQHVSV